MITILHLEDDAKDGELVRALLESAEIESSIARVQSGDQFLEALQKNKFDLILADYRLPGYDGMSALKVVQERYPDVPFIFVSGVIGEDAAIEALKQGATDYVLKQKLSRLVPAVNRALHEAENQRKRKKAEEALVELEILKQVDGLRSEIIGNVSHELRTPLGMILFMISALQKEDLNLDAETRSRFMKDIEHETLKLQEIVDSLLDISRFQDGKFVLNYEKIDFRQLIDHIYQGITLQKNNHTFVQKIPERVMLVRIDSRRIEQVIYNLLDNAIKYSPNNSTIVLEADLKGEEIKCSIQDEGMGIPKQEKEKIFERFYRLNDPNRPGIPGIGLGLSISREIIRAHGGQIWVESQPGYGSTFSFTLPVKQVD